LELLLRNIALEEQVRECPRREEKKEIGRKIEREAETRVGAPLLHGISAFLPPDREVTNSSRVTTCHEVQSPSVRYDEGESIQTEMRIQFFSDGAAETMARERAEALLAVTPVASLPEIEGVQGPSVKEETEKEMQEIHVRLRMVKRSESPLNRSCPGVLIVQGKEVPVLLDQITMGKLVADEEELPRGVKKSAGEALEEKEVVRYVAPKFETVAYDSGWKVEGVPCTIFHPKCHCPYCVGRRAKNYRGGKISSRIIEDDELRVRILNNLRYGTRAAHEILKEFLKLGLVTDKASINRCLYRLEEDGKVLSTHEGRKKWRLSAGEAIDSKRPIDGEVWRPPGRYEALSELSVEDEPPDG